MARAVHRVSLLVLPSDPERPPADLDAAWSALVDAGFVRVSPDASAREGHAGARALVDGGFTRAWLDDGPRGAKDRAPVRFVGNRLGGFRVGCAACGANLAGPFGRALEAWRAGGPRALRCASCGRDDDLSALRFAPEAGFARAWLALEDVRSVDLLAEPRALLADALGGVRIVLRRG